MLAVALNSSIPTDAFIILYSSLLEKSFAQHLVGKVNIFNFIVLILMSDYLL